MALLTLKIQNRQILLRFAADNPKPMLDNPSVYSSVVSRDEFYIPGTACPWKRKDVPSAAYDACSACVSKQRR